MNRQKILTDLISPLVGLFLLSFQTKQNQDAEKILCGLRLIRPKYREFDLLDAWLRLQNYDITGASHVLRGLVSARPDFQMAKAMLALCLNTLNDSEWEIFANEVLQNGTDYDACNCVKGLFNMTDKQERAFAFDDTTLPASSGAIEIPQSYALRA
jgi:type III secretion protein HrpB1